MSINSIIGIEDGWFKNHLKNGVKVFAPKTFARNVFMNNNSDLETKINALQTQLNTANSKIAELEAKEDMDTFNKFLNMKYSNTGYTLPTTSNSKIYTATKDCWITLRPKYGALGGYAAIYVRDENGTDRFVFTHTCGGSAANNHYTQFIPLKAGWSISFGTVSSLSSGYYYLIS